MEMSFPVYVCHMIYTVILSVIHMHLHMSFALFINLHYRATLPVSLLFADFIFLNYIIYVKNQLFFFVLGVYKRL